VLPKGVGVLPEGAGVLTEVAKVVPKGVGVLPKVDPPRTELDDGDPKLLCVGAGAVVGEPKRLLLVEAGAV